jgi:hypothetical protein
MSKPADLTWLSLAPSPVDGFGWQLPSSTLQWCHRHLISHGPAVHHHFAPALVEHDMSQVGFIGQPVLNGGHGKALFKDCSDAARNRRHRHCQTMKD